MKTNIKFPNVPFEGRVYYIQQRCSYLCDNEVQKAVVEGRFVLAWDGELGPGVIPSFGALDSISMKSDGSRTYVVNTDNHISRVEFQNAVVLREDWCPEVVCVDKFGQHFIHRWIGLQERTDGKVYAVITNSGDISSRDVDPSTLILLDDCKVGLPECEEKF